MNAKLVIQISALSGFLAVALGAFGAHGLKKKLSQELMSVYQTAVEYHFVHTLALLAVGLLIQQWGKSAALTTSASAFTIGIILFSGSLYLLSITGSRWLGPITPIGGLAFLTGWISLFWAALRAN